MKNKKTILWVLGVVGLMVLLAALYYFVSLLWNRTVLEEALPSTAVTIASNRPVIATESHPASGVVSVLQTGDETVLRYENFSTINGPDLKVYLSSDLEATEFIDLGELKATNGSINYVIPPGTDLSLYRYALVWCKQFGVLFNSVDISPEIEITSTTVAKAQFANGCFWCVEHDLEKVPGVLSVVSGYAGGTTEQPTYKTYSDGGHREVVEVTYNPQIVTYANLVEHIIKHGDPTDAEGSFYDRGVNYAPAIYYQTEEEKEIARAVIAAVNATGIFEDSLPLVVLPQTTFWPAEEYHQDYAKKNPLKYGYYRSASGRTKFFEGVWGSEASTFTISNQIKYTMEINEPVTQFNKDSWNTFKKPELSVLKNTLSDISYKVTQENGTERAGSSPLDKNYEQGIYVDIVSGEPLFFSRDKYDSGTGWPSFVKPISDAAVTLHEDRGFFSVRTEVRSRFADSHLGHVFDDGPADHGGKRYCMNGAALRFIAKDNLEAEGYGYLLSEV